MTDSLHPRNRHRGGLDFARLTQACPALDAYVFTNAWGNQTIDFAEPAAIKWLNAALLKSFYGVEQWHLPEGYLCPSVPGRADYIHLAADLLASSNGGAIPRGPSIRALDIGVGASCVYPLIGHAEYGWAFLGSDIDAKAIANAKKVIESNSQLGLRAELELRLQRSPGKMLTGLLHPGERFHLSLCNPPFHGSPKEAEESSRRKWKNLGKAGGRESAPRLNFGGQNRELWCPGGESSFVRKLIGESGAPEMKTRVLWFTTLISKSANLPSVYRALKQAGALETRTLEMKQGQKTSRIVAWTFIESSAHRAFVQPNRAR